MEVYPQPLINSAHGYNSLDRSFFRFVTIHAFDRRICRQLSRDYTALHSTQCGKITSMHSVHSKAGSTGKDNSGFAHIRPRSYGIQRNNANYTAITPFKVIQGHRFWYQWKAHMRLPILVINSNLLPILRGCAVSQIWQIIGRIFAIDSGVPHFNAPLEVFPCEYPEKLYLSRN